MGEAAAQKQGGQRNRGKAGFRLHGCSPDDLNRADFTRFQAAWNEFKANDYTQF